MAYALQPQLQVLTSCEYFTLPAVLQSKQLQLRENEQVLDTALADLPRPRSCMEETLGIQASNDVGFFFCFVLRLVCIFPCLIH